MAKSLLFLLLYALLDTLTSVLLLGFFHSSWSFDPDQISHILLLKDGYNFMTNPADFVILSLLRLGVVAAIFIVSVQCEDRRSYLTLFVFSTILSYTLTLIKLLALSETTAYLNYPGLWLIVAWSLVSSAILTYIAIFFLYKNPKNYEELTNERDLEAGEATQPRSGKEEVFHQARKLLGYCAREWPRISAGFFCMFIYALARIFIPAMMGTVIANIIKGQGYDMLIHSVLIMTGLAVTSSIFGGLRGYFFMYTTEAINQHIRRDLFGSLVKQDIAFFDVTKSGEVVSRLTSDCQAIATMMSTNVNVFLRNGVMIIGAAGYMFSISWRLAMLTIVAVPIISAANKLFGAYFKKISEENQTSISKANQVAEEVLSSMRTVRSFASEDYEYQRFSDKVMATLNIAKRKSLIYMFYTWNTEMLNNAMRIIVLFYGGNLVLKGLMSADDLVTFLLYQMQMGENFNEVSWVFSSLMEALGASKKVFEFMERIPEIPNSGKDQPPVSGGIEFKNVHFTYPSRKQNPVLQALNLSVPSGETLALVGPSGGGKSSIVSLLEHFYEPDIGEILLDGRPIKEIHHKYYHQKVSLVAQEPVLYDGTIRENILYACPAATEDDMLRASQMANVHHFVMEMEKGYDTTCGEKGVQMSGGQKQRIAIARALVRNPVVLILDEATSALDSESEALVQDALNKCARERTVLIIAHRLSTIENANKIAVIKKGAVVQFGSHSDLMADKNGMYYSLVSRQLLLEEPKEDT